MRKNKKAISAVVATVLIILITVAAVTIIWAAIIPMINDQLNKGTVCLDAMSALTIKGEYTCYDGADLHLQVSYGSKDVNLEGIQVLIEDGAGNVDSSNTITADLPDPNENKVFPITIGAATSVAIAPVVTVGSGSETCDASAYVEVSSC